MTDEDAKLLKYAGLLGHEFVGITGEPGERRVSCQVSGIDSAKRLSAGQTHLIVYGRRGSGKRLHWQDCYNADQAELAREIRKASGWPDYPDDKPTTT